MKGKEYIKKTSNIPYQLKICFYSSVGRAQPW